MENDKVLAPGTDNETIWEQNKDRWNLEHGQPIVEEGGKVVPKTEEQLNKVED